MSEEQLEIDFGKEEQRFVALALFLTYKERYPGGSYYVKPSRYPKNGNDFILGHRVFEGPEVEWTTVCKLTKDQAVFLVRTRPEIAYHLLTLSTPDINELKDYENHEYNED